MAKSSKPPKRYDSPKQQEHPKLPDGTWQAGVNNNEFREVLGQIVGYWPHVEDQMIEIMGLLLGDRTPARQVFRAIVANQSRIKVMRALLERSQHNITKGAEYDEIISEFDSLVNKRNAYLHGLWYTHHSGRVFLAESSIDDGHWFEQREVPIEELINSLRRMGNLWRRILIIQQPHLSSALSAAMRPLLEIPPPQLPEETA
jgi:hypothetical protein